MNVVRALDKIHPVALEAAVSGLDFDDFQMVAQDRALPQKKYNQMVRIIDRLVHKTPTHWAMFYAGRPLGTVKSRNYNTALEQAEIACAEQGIADEYEFNFDYVYVEAL